MAGRASAKKAAENRNARANYVLGLLGGNAMLNLFTGGRKVTNLKLKKNEFLNWEYQIDDEGDKNLLMKRAQKGIKEYKNYAAYYNAAVVAFGNRNWEGVGPTDTDLANVVLYSGKAMELGKAHTAPEMYLLRAEARMRQLDFMYA